MASNVDKESYSKKKSFSKWKKRVNIAGLGSKDKGQGFAQVRRTKAIYEYKKLLRRTRKQQQQKSSYVENIYSSELNRDTTKNEDKTLSTSEDRHTTQGGEERKTEIPIGVLEKRTKNCVGEWTKVFQGTFDEKTKEPLGVVERGAIVKESTGKQRESIKALSKQTKVSNTKRPSTLNNKNFKRENKSRYTEARKEYHKKKLDNAKLQKEKQEHRDKKLQEIQASQAKRRVTYHELSKRTRKGQPVMSNQINHLLSKLTSDT